MKRLALQVLLFLALGALANVAVVWTLALAVDVDNRPGLGQPAVTDDEIWRIYAREYPGTTLIAVVPMMRGKFLIGKTTGYSSRSRFNRHPILSDLQPKPTVVPASIVPRWARIWEYEKQTWPDEPMGLVIDIARGWPCRAISVGIDQASHPALPGSADYVNCIYLDDSAQSGEYNRRALPLRPIWPGFAINTLFYAGSLWLLFVFPFTMRRMMRRVRNRCAACGYPIGTSELCTECGKPVRLPADGQTTA